MLPKHVTQALANTLLPFKANPRILLCPNVPKPMHGMAPRIVFGNKWWDQTRKAAYKSTNYHCEACGVHKAKAKGRQWLEGHELYRIEYRAGRMIYLRTTPLCHFCHNYIHSGRLQMLLETGKVHHAKYAAIIQHGDRILNAANLIRPRPLPYAGILPSWDSWRLVIDGKEYPGLFKSEAEWYAYHAKLNTDE